MLEKQLLINNQEQQLQGKKVNLEDKLKILISQLNPPEEEKQILEGNKAEEIERLTSLKKKSDEDLQETREKLAEQEKLVEQLQKEQKQAEKADIKKLEEKENMEEQLKIMQQRLLNNQEQQKLEEKLKDVDKRSENIDGETKKPQEQTKDQRSSIVSLRPASTAKSTTGSSLSKWWNLPNKLLKNKNLERFLSDKNEELKKSFPEFKEKHFCHNVLNKTIESLLNQGDGKFESSKLLKLLENNMKESAREIIKESAETRVKSFSSKIQELQLVLSIRDKFLSPDQGMCNKTQGNEYQLTERAKKDLIPP